MRRRGSGMALFCLVALALSFDCARAQQCAQLVWSDEFTGTSLDLNKWQPQIGDGCDIGLCGWGNNELQYYQAANATVSGGTLKITAKKERVRAKQYTSARLRTLNLGDWTYGRFEARIKLPAGQGLWPAFWMLPTDEVYGGWPQSGEIDILEVKGQSTSVIYGTIHFGDPYPNNRNSGSELLNVAAPFSDAFHVYAIEWEPNEIRWYLDDKLFGRKTPSDLRGRPWPFDQRFHLLMNMAVGGTFVGAVDNSIFPKSMEVDYVRVYNRSRPTMTGAHRVAQNQIGIVYSVQNAASGASYSWSVPPGAAIVSGQGTNTIVVDFASSSGNVGVVVGDGCGGATLAIPVTVEPPDSLDRVYEDFESNRLPLLFASGALNDSAANPNPAGVNSSPVVARYVRDIGSQYDTLVYGVSSIPDASVFTGSAKRFYLDVYTTAPPGTTVSVQLEDSTKTTGSNFPTGRHSTYLAKTSVSNQWERLRLDFNARWDGGTADNAIDTLVVLLDGGWFSGDTYYLDNLSAYASGPADTTPPAAPTALTATPASSNRIDLDWANNSEPDLASYSVYRSTVSGFTPGAGNRIASGVLASAYSNTGLAASTTYYYKVTALDATGNESAPSNQASATTSGSCTAASTHVASIAVTTVNAGQGSKRGQAQVTVVNNCGVAVSGASVSGTFTGDFNETLVSISNSSGVATLTTAGQKKGSVALTFCVTSIAAAGLTYNPSANVQTCASL